MSEYLFDTLSETEERIRSADKVVLFLDYDGTLANYNKDSMKALPSREMIRVLNNIIKNPKVEAFIITGRNKDRMEKLMWLDGLRYICSHGFEMGVPDFSINVSAEDKAKIREIFSELRKEFADRITDMNMKGDIGINFNYRPYEGNHNEIEKRFIEIVTSHDTDKKFRILRLSKAFNVIPKTWNKGKAVDYILRKYAPGVLPVYFGDDTTDEDAFEVLKNRGITVYVKNNDKRETHANYFVNDPDEVLKTLQRLFN